MIKPITRHVAAAACLLTLGACTSDVVLPDLLESYSIHESAENWTEWSEPVHLGDVINSSAVDIETSISRDGLSLYLSSNRPGGQGGFDIWVARRARANEPWGAPENLGPSINTSHNEQGPSLTRDGHRLFFFSNRPGGFGGNDIYVARRRDGRDDFGWRSPQNVGGGVNSSSNDNLPHFYEDETGLAALYFNSNRPGGFGGTDIYVSVADRDGSFGPATHVSELGSPGQDAGFVVARDGLEAMLASNREGTIGRFDLWVTTRSSRREPWSPPENLGPIINTEQDESRLALSFDASSLFIVSDRPAGTGGLDIWVSTRRRQRR